MRMRMVMTDSTLAKIYSTLRPDLQFVIKLKGEKALVYYSPEKYVIYPGDGTVYDSQTRVWKTFIARGPEDARPPVTKTKEKEKILDYTCTKYVENDGVNSPNFYWYTSKLDYIDLRDLLKDVDMFNFPLEKGFPMRIESKTQLGTELAEVVSIKKETLPDSDFDIPAGYDDKRSDKK